LLARAQRCRYIYYVHTNSHANSLRNTGTTKKGKAARQGMELLARGQEATQRERDLMRAVPEIGMINAMVGCPCRKKGTGD